MALYVLIACVFGYDKNGDNARVRPICYSVFRNPSTYVKTLYSEIIRKAK